MSGVDASQPVALAGVRVLDLSRVLAGPWATQILGDFGAEIIKVERPGVGDDTRTWGPPFLETPEGGQGDAAYYLAANRNKRSVTIDLARPEGAELARDLAKRSHILVENFKTGALARYGLDYAAISAINPALVYCSITGFGQTGPYAERAGYDYVIQAMGGLMSLTGEPAGAPMKSAVAVADLFSGMVAVTSILAALRHAERTGEGQHIDVALLDCQVAMLANLGASFLVTGAQPERLGNQHASIAPYQVFDTADGRIVLAVGNDAQFRDFCDAAGVGLAEDARFAANAARVTHRAALTAELTALMRQRTTAAWIAALECAEVPCGPVNTLDQVFADPQVIARGMVQEVARSDGSRFPITANPARLSATPPAVRSAPPRLGQDTDHVMREVLGLGDAEIAALRAAGAI